MADADRRSALLSAAYLFQGRPLEAFQLDVMSKQPRVLAVAATFEDWLKDWPDEQSKWGEVKDDPDTSR